MSLPMARCLTLLGLLHLFSVRLLTLCLFLMLVLMAEATSNRQGIYINRQFNIFWTYSRKRNIYLTTIWCLTDVHRCHQCWRAGRQTGLHKTLFKQLIHRTAQTECLAERIRTSNHRSVPPVSGMQSYLLCTYTN